MRFSSESVGRHACAGNTKYQAILLSRLLRDSFQNIESFHHSKQSCENIYSSGEKFSPVHVVLQERHLCKEINKTLYT